VPPYDKGSAIATLTAVMTEPLEEPKNAGPLRDVIYGLLTKDPAKRLDDAGARAMLNAVIHAPEPKAEPEHALDATKVVPLPPQPDGAADQGRSGTGTGTGSGGKRGEEAAERLRGALRSVRKAAVGAGAAGAAAARAKSADETAGSGSGARDGGGATHGSSTGLSGAEASSASTAGGSSRSTGTGSKGAGTTAAGVGAHASTGVGERDAETAGTDSGGRSSGWPVMPPPDLPPRPVPRAPLTDVVPKRTLVIIAVVVALAVIGAVVALTLPDDGSKASGSGGGDKVSASASAGADTKQDEKSGTHTDGAASPPESTGAGSGSGDGAGSKPSAGAGATGESGGEAGSGSAGGAVSTYKGGQGYSIGLPKGWRFQSTRSAGDRFTGPDGQKLLIAWTSTPKDDPVADWKNQERGMVRSQYKKIRIEAVDYRGWNTADWEFTYVEGGTKYRTIDRGFVVHDSLGYALMYTAKAADWDGDLRKDTWRTLTKTFQPKS
jgi:hypothetical protein